MTVIFPMPGNETLAAGLAARLQAELGQLETREFPDGESYLRFTGDVAGRTVLLLCTLERPDAKIPRLLFAADAARDLGAGRIGLIAPYLCYMRQDRRCQPGEAVTSRSFAALISRHFDWLVTVDPHLHRYRALPEIYSLPALALHAGPVIAEWIKTHVSRPILIGPDAESSQWVESVAAACGASWTVLTKTRTGDRQVRETPLTVSLAEHTPVLLDDIISSGASILEALRQLTPHAERPLVIAIHALCSEETRQAIAAAGARLISTNSVPNPAAEIDIMPLLADGIAGMIDRRQDG